MQLADKTVLVTGATNGVGQVTALELARMGATTVIVSRSAQRVNDTVNEIKAKTGNLKVHGMVADLSLMSEVSRIADEFRAQFSTLHVLVNNAGMIFDKRQETREGLEMTFALNHMSYFLLTLRLLDMLKAAGTSTHRARIVSISSEAHQMARIDFDDLQRRKSYGFRVYGDSKLMNLLFTYELARRLQAENAPVTANAVHPGGVATGFGQNTSGIVKFMTGVVMRPFFKTPEQGAETQIYLASSPEVEGVTGKYYDNKRPTQSTPASHDQAAQRRLWEVSEQIAAQYLPTRA